MIKVESVSYKYDTLGKEVLKNVSFQIDKGAYIGLIGPNGCGKTTLLKHLNALLLPAKGNVTIEGRQLDAWSLTFLPLPLGGAAFRGWINLAMEREGFMLLFSAFHPPFSNLMVSQ